MFDLMKIGEVVVNVDEDGRYCLNDLHKASGGAERHGPSKWLRNSQVIELIQELETGQICPVNRIEGRAGGTYVSREMVYAYAMWISPSFHLKVIRFFDDAHSKPEVAKIPVDPRFDMVMHGLNSFKASQDNAAMQGFVEADVNDPSDYFSMGKLLKRRGAIISSQVANRALAFKGVIQRGAEAGQPHCDWVVTEKGSKYGFNWLASRSQGKTEPRWYRDREEDLYIFIMAVVNEMGVLSTVPTLTSALAEAVEIVPDNATSPALEQARQLPIYPGMFQKLKNLINFK